MYIKRSEKFYKPLHFVLEMSFLSDKTTHLTRHVKEALFQPQLVQLAVLLGQVTTLTGKMSTHRYKAIK